MKPETLKSKNREAGKGILLVLALFAVVAVGAIVYLSMQKNQQQAQSGEGQASAAVTSSEPASGKDKSAKAEQVAAQTEQSEAESGSPVVAKVNGENITRLDVFNFIKNLPENLRSMPAEQLYPMALEQVINARLIEAKTANLDMSDNPEVQEQLERVKQQIMRNVYLQQEVEKRMTEERLREAYQSYKDKFEKVEEVKASHVLVDSKEKAEEVLKSLEKGKDFSELAEEHSKDATAQEGGNLGYFTKSDVVPAFGDAAFSLKPGTYTKEPVKSEFGYHIVKVEDKRMRQPPSFEEAKPFLESNLRRALLDKVIQDWKEESEIVRYNINGEPIEPSAGGDPVYIPGAQKQQDSGEGEENPANTDEEGKVKAQ